MDLNREVSGGDANDDEAAVRPYTLPDPLIADEGRVIDSPTAWRERRREILRQFEACMFGRAPAAPPNVEIAAGPFDEPTLGALAVRRQLTLAFGADAPRLHLLLYLPSAARGPSPMFLGPNFLGNHTIHADRGIRLSDAVFVPGMDVALAEGHATEASRGRQGDRWPVEDILRRGYGLATFFYGDVFPDRADGRPLGIQPRFDTGRDRFSWGAIATWSWAMSRALDALSAMPEVDAARVALFGHSRHGKAALWAGALDERFRLVIANNSGKGGASLARRNLGETIRHLVMRYPHWFTSAYADFAGDEAALPVDQHMLIALIAPRPVYIASAEDDLWADPKGEFLAARAASPVYRLLGAEGLVADELPPIDSPVQSMVGYHIRRGAHGVTQQDWEWFLDFADRHMP